jgi:hypothetical protein
MRLLSGLFGVLQELAEETELPWAVFSVDVTETAIEPDRNGDWPCAFGIGHV